MRRSLSKGTKLPTPESELQPLFEGKVKISEFQIFTDSDRKKCELLSRVHT